MAIEVENAKDYQPGAKGIMTVGFGGAGKTAQLTTLKGKKFVHVFDPRALEVLAGSDVDYKTFLVEQLDLDAVTLKGGVRDQFSTPPVPMTYVNFETFVETAIAEGFYDSYDIIAIDSATLLQAAVMDRVMYINEKFGKWPDRADYTGTAATTMKVLRTFAAMTGKILYLTAHMQMNTDESTKSKYATLSLLSFLKNQAPLLFSDIWYLYPEAQGDAMTKWLARIQPTREFPWIRTSLKNIEAPTYDVTIPDLSNPVGEGIQALLDLG